MRELITGELLLETDLQPGVKRLRMKIMENIISLKQQSQLSPITPPFLSLVLASEVVQLRKIVPK